MNTYEELYHHGIKGMQWGVRRFQNRDGSLTPRGQKRRENDDFNERYKPSQRFDDENMYSKGAVRRINKNMNKGASIKSARSLEADRINSYRKKAKDVGDTSGRIGKLVGGLLGGAVGLTIANQIDYGLANPTALAMTAAAVGAGVHYGKKAGKSLGEKGTMLAGGYNPRKLR